MDITHTRHPKVLPFLFLTELWERFGFYVVQGLLILYMTSYYGFSDNESYTISGIFAGLVYISPFVGGILADKFIGFTTAILCGGIFLVLGYALLALSSTPFFFYPALATIIVGNGLLKPNISSLLGTQYAEHDPRRDAGFTIFYIGINIGVTLSLISGYVKDAYSWHLAFTLASLGMIIGLATFLYGQRYLKPFHSLAKTSTKTNFQLLACMLLAIVGLSFLFNITVLANWLLPITGLALLFFLINLTMQQEAIYRNRMIMLNLLIIASIVFWTLFFQLFNSATLYIDRLVDKNFLNIPLTTTVFYASEGIFIIILGHLFVWLWQTLAHQKRNPSPITKFTLGIAFMGLGFFILGTSTLYPNAQDLIPAGWIFTAYLFITIGELLVSPIGLSAVTMLAPPKLIGMMMGIWFVSLGFGGFFAGWVAKLSDVPNAAMSTTDKLNIYHHAFLEYAYLAFFVAVVLILVNFSIKKLMRD